MKKDIKGFSGESINAMVDYKWPGNVRELENRIKRAIVMADGDVITSKDIDLITQSYLDNLTLSLKEAKDKVEKDLIQKALLKHGGVVVRAAEDLGVTRQTLTYLIKKYGILTI